MKKVIVYSLVGAMLLSSCSTTESGASNGAFFGSIIGSAIGGISGGHRGSDIGTLVGMAGGAVVGAAIGQASEKAEQRKYDEYMRRRTDSGFDPNNGGDDRIVMETEVPSNTVSLDELKNMTGYNVNINESIQLRHENFTDANGDGNISPGEECKVSFEIMNNSDVEIFNVIPTVIETTGNKHIHISPTVRVESIKPHQGVRYTATILADKRLKDGNAVIRVTVTQGQNDIASMAKEFNITCKRQ
ncbi:MAG: hypothetical protein SPG55_05925 [Prevotella sp.]|nr:hypothetical protein [Prevotella sp.]MDD7030120.1 hypothetical protein [Prevotellaceae bacterium]MCI7015979.1 hypothetical protein [Prevotella sp.]MDD7075579.1 hypothetical protein [Prevotellaceae bacterium]MDY3252344.1 hypothetical protein [Prevotella sp.]